MDGFLQDLRFAARALHRSPLFALSTIATLGLGLGILTGFFAIVEAVLLTPIPIHGDTVVRIWKLDPQRSIARYPLSYPELRFWRERASSFQSLAAIGYADAATAAVLIDDETIATAIAPVSADFFDVAFGGEPLLGRWFSSSDEGNATEVPTVVSERFWRRVSGADPAFIGRRLRSPGGGRLYIVVGIAPARLDYPTDTDFWVPIDGYYTADTGALALDIRSRRFNNFHFLGRLRPGVTVERARAELDVVSRGVVAQFPDDYREAPIVVEPLLGATLGTLGPLTWFLFGGAALVFLAAGGNVAALLAMRASSRAREMALRIALGAGRSRLARSTLVESALLGIGGATLGFVIGHLCVILARLVAAPDIPRLERASIDASVMTFGIAATLAWVVSLGTAPVWRWRPLRAASLTHHLAIRSTRSTPLLRIMIVAQVTAAVVIATAAGLLIRSLAHLNAVDRGFDVRNLAVVELLLPDVLYPSAPTREAFFSRLLARLAVLPGVVSATTVHLGPGTGQAGLSARMLFEGQAPADGRNNPYGTWEPVTPSYFDTLRIPLVQGRLFTDADDPKGAPVAIVSESVAERYWPGQPALGKQLQFTPQSPWATVVGVVADTRYRELTRNWLTVYFPARQFFFFQPGAIAVRTRADADAAVAAIRETIRREEPDATIHSVKTMEALMSREIARPQTAVAVALVFALIAIVVAAVGVYAVFAYDIADRGRELAVRAAVGATPSQILGGVLQQALLIGAAGAVIGLGVSSLATRALQATLFEVAPLDVTTFGIAGAGLLAIVVLASVIPARRAARVEPTLLLRSE